MPEQRKPAPKVAFLGFCDRADQIDHGHPALWGWNLIGLSPSRAFYVFPADIAPLKMAVAIYDPKPGEILRLDFRTGDGKSAFYSEIRVESVHALGSSGGVGQPSAQEEHPLPPGWVFAVMRAGDEVVVTTPGVYEVFLSSEGQDLPVGSALLLQAQVAPFSQEEIATIKSDPLALKFVRIQIACKKCGDVFKAYAGIERSQSSEDQGFVWNHDISKDEFVCTCGEGRASLIPIRTGLHGLLRRNVSPTATPNVSAERLYERTVLERACKDLLDLAAKDTKEEGLQRFLESNSIFFHMFLPKRIFFKPRVLTKYVADFALVNERDELVLVEIERASLRLLKKDRDATSGLTHAFNQVRTWVGVFDDYRAAALEGMGLKLDEVARVRGVVIAGRTPPDERSRKALRGLSTAEIELFTYDDLRKGVSEIIKQIANA